jgi:hypothetical protein
MRRFLLLYALIVTALCSCIKEDRSKCPCYLYVDLSRVDTYYITKVDLMTSGSAGAPQWTAVERNAIGDTVILKVTKDEIDFCAWGNIRGSAVLNDSRTIVSSGQPDSLWSCYRRISARCEDMYVTVEPQRQYIPVTIIVRGMLQNISDVQPVITSVSQGFDFNSAATGDKGTIFPAEVRSPQTAAGYYQFNALMLTQQSATEASLELDFKSDGRPVKVNYPLGEELYKIGENISLSGQKPVVVDLVIGGGTVFFTISVSDWEQHATIDIIY